MLAFLQSDLSRFGRFTVPQIDHCRFGAITGKIVAKFSLASISIVALAIYCLAVSAERDREWPCQRLGRGRLLFDTPIATSRIPDEWARVQTPTRWPAKFVPLQASDKILPFRGQQIGALSAASTRHRFIPARTI